MVPLTVFVTLAAAFVFLWGQASARHSDALARDTELLAEQAALRLDEVGRSAEEVAHHMLTAWRAGLASLAGFDGIAEPLVRRYPELLSIVWIGPGQVVEHAYPQDSLAYAGVGSRLVGEPRISPYLDLARSSGEVVFTPPFDLSEDVDAVAGYLRLDGTGSDGFVGVIFSMTALVQRLGGSVQEDFDTYLRCTVLGDDPFEVSYGPRGVGDDDYLERPLVRSWKFEFDPHGWELFLAPRTGNSRAGTSTEEDLFLTAGLLLALALALVVGRELHSRRALRASERRYRGVVQDLPDFVCRYRRDGTITFANEAFAARYGKTADELIGTSLYSLYPETEWSEINRHLASLEAGRQVESLRQVDLEGDRTGYVRWRERVIVEGGPESAEVQSVGYDVTEAREAEEQLRHSQERYRTLVESSPDGVVIHRNGKIVFANDALAKLVGAQGTWELAGMELSELLPTADGNTVEQRIAGVMEDGQPVRYDDEQIRHRSGHLIEVEVIGTRVVFDGQRAVQAILRDVTERRASERALRESEERFRTIFGSISDAVIIHDRHGALLEVNQSACDLFGLSRDVLLRLDFGALLSDSSPATLEFLRARFAAARTSPSPELVEFSARRGRDEQWWAEVSLRAAKVDGRERLLSVVRDVTERREAQEALSEASNRLDHLLSTGPTVIYSRTPGVDGSLTFVSRNVRQLLGLEPDALTDKQGHWRSAIVEGDRVRVDGELTAADARGDRFTCEYRIETEQGKTIWIQDDARLLRDDGQAVEWVGCWRDVTIRKRIEHSQRLMMDELDHRVKNTLAMVLSLLDQTLAQTRSRVELRDAFRGRIEALAHAHEALAKEHWEAVDLERISRQVLGPNVELGRVSVVGPPQPLDARTASPLALALHELVTNAVKHGALSVDAGHVDLTWELEARGLVVKWRERGGPPAAMPTESGTGLRLVRGLIEHELGGRAIFDFHATGLEVEVILPTSDTAPRPRLLVDAPTTTG